MASDLSMQIKCSLCLSDFTDPVMLSCEHCFCRQCITGHMHGNRGQQCLCPYCRRPYTEKDLHSSRLLRNMTGIVRQHLTTQQSQGATSPTKGSQYLGDMLGTVKGTLGFLAKENTQLDMMTQQQASEVTKTQMRSKQLSDQISAQFEEMHRILKKKEKEIKKHLDTQEQEAVTAMCKNTSTINKGLMDGKELECIFQSALAINQPDLFLQWWNEKGFLVTERMKMKNSVNPDIMYESRVKGLRVIPHSFFIGPYETHLQFFAWKSMLGDIKPVPEILSIKDPRDSYLKVSPGKSSIRQADRQYGYYKSYSPGVVSEQTFQSGQHYWEIDVGNKFDWSIGVKTEVDTQSTNQSTKSKNSQDVYLNLVNDKGYTISANGKELPTDIHRKPSKIGLYLDCDRKQITFYDADIMTQISVTNYKSALPCSISLFPGVYLDGNNTDPLTICSYVSNSAHSP